MGAGGERAKVDENAVANKPRTVSLDFNFFIGILIDLIVICLF